METCCSIYSTSAMTHLEKVLAVIDAQAKGGYIAYAPFTDGRKVELNHGMLSDDTFDWHILLILLDSSGAKASYGEEAAKETATSTTHTDDGLVMVHTSQWSDWSKPMWEWATHKILTAWHSEEGNNYRAAIDTAHSLL